MPQTGRKSPRMEDESRVCLNGGHAGVQAGRDLAVGEGGCPEWTYCDSAACETALGIPARLSGNRRVARAGGPRLILADHRGLIAIEVPLTSDARVHRVHVDAIVQHIAVRVRAEDLVSEDVAGPCAGG